MINSASTVHLGWVKNTEAKVETQRRRWVGSRVGGEEERRKRLAVGGDFEDRTDRLAFTLFIYTLGSGTGREGKEWAAPPRCPLAFPPPPPPVLWSARMAKGIRQRRNRDKGQERGKGKNKWPGLFFFFLPLAAISILSTTTLTTYLPT